MRGLAGMLAVLAVGGAVGSAGCLGDHRLGLVDGDAGPGPDATPPSDAGFGFVTSAMLPDTVTGIGFHRAWEYPGMDVNAAPYHEVFLSAYEIEGVVENNARYAFCVSAGACAPPIDQELNGGDGWRLPANADAFCQWLGAGWRLPTEAEWENAVRAGVFTPGANGERTADSWDADAYTVALLPWANPRGMAAGTTRTLRHTTSYSRLGIDDVAATPYRCARTTEPQNAVPQAPVPPACVAGCNVVEIAASREHTCARRANQSVICWGDGTGGQLGTGNDYGSHVPRFPVQGVNTAVALAAGAQHTCALLADGTMRCWGVNMYGQLGDGMVVNANVPVTPMGLPPVTAISAANLHTCAMTAGGDIWCWGLGEVVGDFPGPAGSALPVLVNKVPGATMLAAGSAHTCVANATTVTCWGAVAVGTTTMNVPTTAPAVTTGFSGPIQEVTAGIMHTCVRVRPPGEPDEVWCWGGKLGFIPGDLTATDVPVQMSDAATRVVAVDQSTAITDATGQFVPLALANAPLPIVVLDSSVGIGLGTFHTCVVGAGGVVMCGGGNDEGQRGWGPIRSEIIADVAAITFP